MEKKNFNSEIKDLHKQVVAEIIALMAEHNVTEVDLLGSDCAHAFVLGWSDEQDSEDAPMLMEVNKVYSNDGKLMLDVILDIDTEELAKSNENGDIGAAYQCYDANDGTHIMACGGISDVYESVYECLEYDWDNER